MVRKCFVCGQKWTNNSNRSFYKFPRDPIRREEWLTNLSLTSIEIQSVKTALVCSDHFSPEDSYSSIGRQIRLKFGAVPNKMYEDSTKIINDTQEQTFPKIEAEQHNHIEIKDSKCFMDQLIDNEGRIWDRENIPDEVIERKFSSVEHVKCEMDNAVLIIPKIEVEQSEDVLMEQDECLVDQSVSTKRHIWDQKECLINSIGGSENQEDEDNTPHENNDSERPFYNDSTTPEDQHKQQNTKDSNLMHEQYSCRFCDYNTYRKSYLEDHIEAVHLCIKNKKCHICNYSSHKKFTLKRHIELVHMGIKNYKCQMCKYRTSEKKQLEKHIQVVHLGKKGYECPVCECTLCTKWALKRHVDVIHLGKKDYRCDHCEFNTGDKVCLKNHIDVIHLGVKKHKCKLCYYSSYKLVDLKVHMNNYHLGIKQYACRICEFRTNHKNRLKSHIDVIHRGLTKS